MNYYYDFCYPPDDQSNAALFKKLIQINHILKLFFRHLIIPFANASLYNEWRGVSL